MRYKGLIVASGDADIRRRGHNSRRMIMPLAGKEAITGSNRGVGLGIARLINGTTIAMDGRLLPGPLLHLGAA